MSQTVYKADSDVRDSQKVFVGNLPFEASSKDLINLFSAFGEIIEAMIVPDKNNPQKSKGFGFVTFVKKEEALRALELNGKDYNGRALIVEIAKTTT
jgi:cold-inducible RNA-binding protein